MKKRRRLTGVVTSDKMAKTIMVEISRSFRHPLYKKVVRSKNRVMAHDEMECGVGDEVRIVEIRPMSKRKRWLVEEIVKRSKVVMEQVEA